MENGNRGQRSFWTWGYQSDEPTHAQRLEAAQTISRRTGHLVEPPQIPSISDIGLRPSRLRIPDQLRSFVSSSKSDRIVHTYGGHSTELLAAIRGHFPHPPDAVAHPSNESQLEATLEWTDREGIVTIPYGGGTSVVWGVNTPPDAERAVVVDFDCMNRVLEVDDVSRAARFEAGILGPELEQQLKPHGFTLRHYPQSFPWSTVGGWVATRSGGHYATNHTHIDDFVESVRMLTTRGWYESRRLPGSGAGPSPDRLVIGSEGILGLISSCWLRIQKRPRFRATAGVLFPSWEEGTRAVREIAQTKMWPANLRILDPVEARNSAGVSDDQSLLIIGFESADIPQEGLIREAIAIARENGGQVDDEDVVIDDGTGGATGRGGAVGAWRNAFIGVNAGATIGLGLLSDTFETAITWDKWPEFDAAVRTKVANVLREVIGDGATLSCRFTHVYTDGPAPYYSFSGPIPLGAEYECWRQIKDACTEAVISAGGTVTHHHAVGRMHRPGWEKQRPDVFEEMLRGAKRTVDPKSLLNPGVLLSP